MFRLPLKVKVPVPVTLGEGVLSDGPEYSGDANGTTDLPRLSNAADLADEADRFLQECYLELGQEESRGQSQGKSPGQGQSRGQGQSPGQGQSRGQGISLAARRREVAEEIARTGTYEHTFQELEYGARVAWRNSSRCIGRLYWRSLKVRDRRHVTTPVKIAGECVSHLREATNGGKVRPLITVFAPDRPDAPGPRIRNEQLVRYAGHRVDDAVVGDPRNIPITEAARQLGWYGHGTAFDVLPLLVEIPGFRPYVHVLPTDAVVEVPLSHPEHPWFADLGLRWHAVPVISDMCLEIGGLHYRCAPFNGWYMGTEIGSRNLADPDRYDLLPTVAAGLGLDTSTERSLWRDRALVELNLAVLHSYAEAGVTIADHHTESRRFLMHLAKEEEAGRICPAEWSWIVPPLSGGSTAVFHRYYDEVEVRPNFVRHVG